MSMFEAAEYTAKGNIVLRRGGFLVHVFQQGGVFSSRDAAKTAQEYADWCNRQHLLGEKSQEGNG